MDHEAFSVSGEQRERGLQDEPRRDGGWQPMWLLCKTELPAVVDGPCRRARGLAFISVRCIQVLVKELKQKLLESQWQGQPRHVERSLVRESSP